MRHPRRRPANLNLPMVKKGGYDHDAHKRVPMDPVTSGLVTVSLFRRQAAIDQGAGTDPLARWCESRRASMGRRRKGCGLASCSSPLVLGNPMFDYSSPADPINEIIFKLVGILEAAGIPYAITGSFALGIWSEPRASKDVDVVLILDGAPAKVALLRQLAGTGIAVPEAALDDLERHGLAPIVVGLPGGLKTAVELIVPRQGKPEDRRGFTERAIARSVLVPVAGRQVRIVTPEDLAAMKLIMFRTGSRPRQTDDTRDVRDLLYGRLETMDLGYIQLALQVELPPKELGQRLKWLDATVRKLRADPTRPR